MQIRRCMKCMHELREGEAVCPHCGQTNGQVNTEPFALRPGTILDGKYLVGEMLGQGGFGITYIGFDLILEQPVAIKEYFPMSSGLVIRENGTTVVWSSTMMAKTGTEKGFDSFLKEARKMAKLGSIPGVVGVKTVFIENGTAYIVMDYVEGETLLQKLQREGCMDYATAVSLLMPIMKALSQVHTHGIIHRDISPDNIMVRRDGSLVLLDLGAAKDLEIKNSDGTTQHSSQLVAKHGFSPIEQYSALGNIGPWTDVYAMAATVFYCCTREVPPPSVERVVQDRFTCPARLNQAQFQKIASGMAIKADQRPKSMDALIALLQITPIPSLPLQPYRLPKWVPAVAAAVILCAVLLIPRGSSKQPVSASIPQTTTDAAATAAPATTAPTQLPVATAATQPPVTVPETTAQTQPPEKLTMTEETVNLSDYRKLLFSTASASSELVYEGFTYGAKCAIDGNNDTSWQEAADGGGIGEYLKLGFDSTKSVDMICIHPGFATAYKQNCRPSILEFEFSDGTQIQYRFPDENRVFYLKLNRPVETSYIKMTIISVVDAKWKDTCITLVEAYSES